MEEKKSLKGRVHKLSENLKVKVYNGTMWVKDHKEIIGAIAPFAFGALIEIISASSRVKAAKIEQNIKYRSVYDTSTGHWYELKRPLKGKEYIEFDERISNGEKLIDILIDMKLI